MTVISCIRSRMQLTGVRVPGSLPADVWGRPMNVLFLGFVLLAVGLALWQLLQGDSGAPAVMVEAMFGAADLAVEVSLGLIGILTLWSGFFRVAEQSGLTERLARLIAPLLGRLMPGQAARPDTFGPVTLNLSANMLGLDNAATPLGLKAMEAMQRGNPRPDTATDSQIMFLVLNTSSVTLLPVTIFLYRAQQGAADPADVYAPMLLATTASTFVGVWLTARIQGLRLNSPLIWSVALVWLGLLAVLTAVLSGLPGGQASALSSALGNGLLLLAVGGFLLAGWKAGLNVYQVFIEGAREGFNTAIHLIPYLVAMLVAIAMLRAAGAIEMLLGGIRMLVAWTGADTRFVDALPVALLKPLSGSASRAMMLDVMQAHGVDSLAGRMAAVMQGSTETTFYVLAVYFGSVGVTRIRYALWCGLAADGAGLCAAVLATYLFFG